MAVLTYDYQPSDVVYITDVEKCAVYKGAVCQMSADIYNDADDVIVEKVEYLVLLDTTNNTITVSSDNIFATSAEAFDVISEKLDPTP